MLSRWYQQHVLIILQDGASNQKQFTCLLVERFPCQPHAVAAATCLAAALSTTVQPLQTKGNSQSACLHMLQWPEAQVYMAAAGSVAASTGGHDPGSDRACPSRLLVR